MKKRFTPEEHREMGRKLKSIRDELIDLSVKVGNAYPKKFYNHLHKAVKEIDQTRSDLEDEMFKDNPDLSNEIGLNIYYGERK